MIRSKYLNLASVLLLGLGIASCSNNDFVQDSKGQGKIQLDLDVDHTVASRANDIQVTVDDLKIRMTDEEGKYIEYNSVANFEAAEGFALGNYTLEAFYGDADDDGFDKPYVYGSTSVTVRLDETTHATLTAALANSMFKVNYGDAVKAYLPYYAIEFASPSGNNIDYEADQTDPVYVKSGTVDIYFRFTKPNGVTGRSSVAKIEASPKTCYTLNVDMNNGEVGSAEIINVTFNDDLETVTVPVDLDMENVTPPVVEAQGFDDNAISFITTTEYTNPLNFMVIARGGLKSVKLVSTNANYIDSSWPAELELMGMSEADQAKYQALGIDAKGIWKNPDQMALIDLAGVVQHVRLPEGVSTADITFTLVVTDNVNQPNEESPTLTLTATRPTLEVTSPNDVYTDDEEITLSVTYNAIVGNLQFTYLNSTNTNTDLPVKSITDKGNGTYEVVVEKFDDNAPNPLVITAMDQEDNSVKATLSIELLPVLVISENNIWASKVDFKVFDGVNYYTPTNAYYSTDGSSFTEGTLSDLNSDNFYRISGLPTDENGKTYYITVNNPKDSSRKLKAVKVTTEKALQVPYSNMDTWCQYAEDDENTSSQPLYFVGENKETIWGTNNPMTTMCQISVGLFTGVDEKYVRQSGTTPVTGSSAHQNTAARLRAIGWGNGNTGVASFNTAVVNRIDAGLLHLGSSRYSRTTDDRAGIIETDDLDCGISFASRPASISFWYKYDPVHSDDQGLFEYWVKDINGNTLAEGSDYLVSSNNYQEKTYTLNYQVNCLKGAKLYIKFSSTYSANFLQKSSSYMKNEGSTANYLKHGSELYIDDITLNY